MNEYNFIDKLNYNESKIAIKNILAFVWILVKEKIMKLIYS